MLILVLFFVNVVRWIFLSVVITHLSLYVVIIFADSSLLHKFLLSFTFSLVRLVASLLLIAGLHLFLVVLLPPLLMVGLRSESDCVFSLYVGAVVVFVVSVLEEVTFALDPLPFKSELLFLLTHLSGELFKHAQVAFALLVDQLLLALVLPHKAGVALIIAQS